MEKLRCYGEQPYSIAVIHGGPGAAGETAPMARKLANLGGVLEPLLGAKSITGQILELHTLLKENGTAPFTLIGYSWGAWLAYIFAAQYADIIKNIVLIAAPPFKEAYAGEIANIRRSRLSGSEAADADRMASLMNDSRAEVRNEAMANIAEMFSRIDAFDLIAEEAENKVFYDADIFKNVWPQGAALRKSGALLNIGRSISCPVLAIHGDYDPHPAEGVNKPLQAMLKDFKFVLLEKCGHKPWIEKQCSELFYQTIADYLF